MVFVSPKYSPVVIICYDKLLEHGQEQLNHTLPVEDGLHSFCLLLIDIFDCFQCLLDFLCKVQHLCLCSCVSVIAWSVIPLIQALLCPIYHRGNITCNLQQLRHETLCFWQTSLTHTGFFKYIFCFHHHHHLL